MFKGFSLTFFVSSSPLIENRRYDCSDYYKEGYRVDGIYAITPFRTNEKINVYCEMNQGGWTRIFNRVDRNPNFNKTMNEFKNGFGNLETNYWLGLKYMHSLTNNKLMRLRIELSNTDTDFFFIEYKSFVIYPESKNFTLELGEKDFGTLIDALGWHSKMMFTTWDQDNDLAIYNCAKDLNGGFWYNNCHHVSLTGILYYFIYILFN